MEINSLLSHIEIYRIPLILLVLTALLILISKKSIISCIALILLCIISFLSAFHFFIDLMGGNKFDIAVIEHFKFALDYTAIKKFFLPAVSLLSLTAVFIYLFIRAFKYQHLNGFISKPLSSLLPFFALSTVITSSYFHPFFEDIRILVKQHQINESIKLPDGFQHVNQLAPVISYTTPAKKNNFIIIFAEGLEDTFFNDSKFNQLLPNLNTLINNSERHERVQTIRQTMFTNWTHSGLVAALCGLIKEKKYTEKAALLKKTNLIGQSCIGNALSNEGYHLKFIGGSDFGFEAKNRLLKDQGFRKNESLKEILEFYKNKKLDTPPVSKWGIHDDTLFSYANMQLDKLHQRQKQDSNPFGLVLLTLDTHTPGYETPSCDSLQYQAGQDKLLNAVHCADRLISKFISMQLSKPENKDMIIFLISDHIYLGKQSTLSALPDEQRSLHFSVFNKAKFIQPFNNRQATSLDIAPTLLHLLGFEIDTFNLGRNLYEKNSPTLSESLTFDILNANMVPIRKKVNAFWESSQHTLQ